MPQSTTTNHHDNITTGECDDCLALCLQGSTAMIADLFYSQCFREKLVVINLSPWSQQCRLVGILILPLLRGRPLQPWWCQWHCSPLPLQWQCRHWWPPEDTSTSWFGRSYMLRYYLSDLDLPLGIGLRALPSPLLLLCCYIVGSFGVHLLGHLLLLLLCLQLACQLLLEALEGSAVQRETRVGQRQAVPPRRQQKSKAARRGMLRAPPGKETPRPWARTRRGGLVLLVLCPWPGWGFIGLFKLGMCGTQGTVPPATRKKHWAHESGQMGEGVIEQAKERGTMPSLGWRYAICFFLPPGALFGAWLCCLCWPMEAGWRSFAAHLMASRSKGTKVTPRDDWDWSATLVDPHRKETWAS